VKTPASHPLAILVLAGLVSTGVLAPVCHGEVDSSQHCLAAGSLNSGATPSVDCAVLDACKRLVADAPSKIEPAHADIGLGTIPGHSLGFVQQLADRGECTSDTLLTMHVRLNL